jgi:hypothetical protein
LGGKDKRSDRLFCEDPHSKEWMYMEDQNSLDALKTYLNPRGKRESALLAAIDKQRWKWNASPSKSISLHAKPVETVSSEVAVSSATSTSSSSKFAHPLSTTYGLYQRTLNLALSHLRAHHELEKQNTDDGQIAYR